MKRLSPKVVLFRLETLGWSTALSRDECVEIKIYMYCISYLSTIKYHYLCSDQFFAWLVYRHESTGTHRRRRAKPPACIKRQSQGHSHKPLKGCQKKKKKKPLWSQEWAFLVFLLWSGDGALMETDLTASGTFWYKHMQALDSLAPKANKPHFPITPWLQFSRRAPVYAGSSRAVISASFWSATYFLCLSLLYLLDNDIWQRDGKQQPRKPKVCQRKTWLNQHVFWWKPANSCFLCFARQATITSPTFLLVLLFSGLIVAPLGNSLPPVTTSKCNFWIHLHALAFPIVGQIVIII